MKTIQNTEFQVDKIYNRILWNGIVVKTYEKKMGTTTYAANSLEELKSLCENHVPFDNSGASQDYGKGLYNGD